LVASRRISISAGKRKAQSGAHAAFSSMGRAGIEPAALGLKVRVDKLKRTAHD
jgi:hypothetical protein